MLRAVAGIVAGQSASFGELTVSTLTVTGLGLFADGTAALPSIAFADEPGTGIWRSSSGQINFSSNGIREYLFASSGFFISSDLPLQWTSSPAVGGNVDLIAQRDAAGLLGIRNSLAMRGGAGFGAKAIAGSYSVTQDDFTICCSTATQGFTVLLPLSPTMNQLLNIKKVSADANRLKIDGNGNLIDALGFQSTIATNRPNFQLQFGSTIASPTGSAWAIL